MMHSDLRKIAAVIVCTWQESVRNRMLWLAAALVLALLLASLLLSELALTEAARMRTVVVAAGLRAGMVLLLCVHVVHVVAREHADRSLDLVLALDLPRPRYYLARLLGFVLVAACYAGLAALPVMRDAALSSALAWSASLFLELGVVVCAAMFCAAACANLVLATATTLGFYLLARSAAALSLIAHAPSVYLDDWPARAAVALSDLLALLLPDMSRFTMTAWLVDDDIAIQLLYPLQQGLLYMAILAVAGVIDFQRKAI